MITLYFSLFLLQILLRDMGNTYRTNLMPLFTLQKKVVRIICGEKARDHTNILFINLTFSKFFDLIEYKTSALIYKVKYKLFPNSIQRFFCSNEDSLRNTRQRYTITKSLYCTKGKIFLSLVLSFGMAYVLH